MLRAPQKEIRLAAEDGLVGEVGLEPTRIATLDPKSRKNELFGLNETYQVLTNLMHW